VLYGLAMRKRPLGDTGLEVSELALGTWGLSGGGYGPVNDSDQDAVIDRAAALGVTLFETADTYGNGEMERRLGRRLPKNDTIVIATKIGTDTSGSPARKRFDAEFLREAAERSRERLDRERIDVLLLHNPGAGTLRRDEATGVLRELVEKGVVRTWGVSAGNADVAAAALAAGAPVVELAHNAFHTRDLKRIAPELEQKKTGILARSVLAYGLLTGTWPNTKEFADEDHRSQRWSSDELKRRIVQLNALRPSVQGDVSNMRAVALRYVLAEPLVSSAVLGPRKSQQLDQLLRDAGKSPPYLAKESVAALERRVVNLGVKP
jgi:aryl-alcohol dehydrogenase-like predicted oxidoreductase